MSKLSEMKADYERATLAFLEHTARYRVAQAQLAKVRDLVVQARKVSPSESMTIYVTSLERVLGMSAAPEPHKTGQPSEETP
jgi:hypothetical protein